MATMRELKPKQKQPNSATVLNNWITRAEQDMDTPEGGRLSWLVASTVATAVLQRTVAEDGASKFLLKGGTMLQYRLNVPTRATKDVDGLVSGDFDAFITALDTIFAEPWGVIGFKRSEIEIIETPAKIVKPRRFQLTLTLRGVTWRRVQVELSPDEGHAGESADQFPAPQLTAFGLPDPGNLFGLPLRYQIAQKLHAASDPHELPKHINDRARDLVDLLLLKNLAEDVGSPTLMDIRQAGVDIFESRALEAKSLGRVPRSWPPILRAYPHWAEDYAQAAKSAQIDTPLGEAVEILNLWIADIDRAV
jgi:hypothetical protein